MPRKAATASTNVYSHEIVRSHVNADLLDVKVVVFTVLSQSSVTVALLLAARMAKFG